MTSANPRGLRRSRFRRFVILAHAITALAHVPATLAAAAFLPAATALLAGVILCFVTTLRLQGLVRDERRSRALTLLVDVPLLTHWCACVLAMFLFPPVALIGVVVCAVVAPSAPLFGVVTGAALGCYAFAAATASWGVWGRRRFVDVTHVDIPIAGLAPELDGYRIAQISDLHIGNFDTKARGLEWADQVNRLEPDLIAVTGDLVTTGTNFYEDVATVLGSLRARDGVFVSMGNHDQSDPDALVACIEGASVPVLRNAWRAVRRGAAELVIAGLDDRMAGRDDLERTLAGRPARAPTVLMSHYPDFFAEAAIRGVDLVLSGHTHGGQIAVPFMARRANLSRLVRQEAHGLHVRGESRLYVNAGLGTTGPPVRLGVPPEIAVFVLRQV